MFRPWRRGRRVGLDGLLAIAFLKLSFHDPLSAYVGHWYSYNAWQLNRGCNDNGGGGADADDFGTKYPTEFPHRRK